MRNNYSDEDDLIDRLKSAFDSIAEKSMGEYPPEAMKPGTYVRANRLDSLGVILDAFYGDIDLDNKKIVVYTVFLLPNRSQSIHQKKNDYYVSNEYEYEITGYLMLKRMDVSNIIIRLNGGMY
tara:strand:+ start:5831 stop:6199 length:369 start_codon:yes stop_codon:yes gene_type:complete